MRITNRNLDYLNTEDMISRYRKRNTFTSIYILDRNTTLLTIQQIELSWEKQDLKKKGQNRMQYKGDKQLRKVSGSKWIMLK